MPTLAEYKARWREMPNEPLYPFGHGLSYTSFAYAPPQLSAAQLGWDDTLTITTRVTNTGKVAGEEVVQLYVHDRVASRVRPVRELKGFRKLLLQPGESQDVVFTLTRDALAFTNHKGGFGAEPGLFDVWVRVGQERRGSDVRVAGTLTAARFAVRPQCRLRYQGSRVN